MNTFTTNYFFSTWFKELESKVWTYTNYERSGGGILMQRVGVHTESRVIESLDP